MLLTSTADGTDTHPTQTLQLEKETRYIETVITKYSERLNADYINKCLETLAVMLTNLLIDRDEINARVGTFCLDCFQMILGVYESDMTSLQYTIGWDGPVRLQLKTFKLKSLSVFEFHL